MNCPLHLLSERALLALAASLRDGVLSVGLSRSELDAICGASGGQVADYLEKLKAGGFTPEQASVLVESVIEGRTGIEPISHIAELIISGPDVPGIPVGDTFAAMHGLVAAAKTSILIAGYAIYNGKTVFAQLAKRMDEDPNLKVRFIVHVGRHNTDTTTEVDLVRRFGIEFVKKQWPGARLPEMFYDPRGTRLSPTERANFHAKCVIVDESEALITSANFTAAAQTKNIEVGVRLKSPLLARRLANYFAALAEQGSLRPLPLGR